MLLEPEDGRCDLETGRATPRRVAQVRAEFSVESAGHIKQSPNRVSETVDSDRSSTEPRVAPSMRARVQPPSDAVRLDGRDGRIMIMSSGAPDSI